VETAPPIHRTSRKDRLAKLFEIFDNYGILILGGVLLVYPFFFDALIGAIFWLEDTDYDFLTMVLSEIRGFVPSTPLMIQIIIYSLFGMAFNILLGNTGMLSLGHCAFFGVGGYTVGLMHAWFKPGTPVPAWITNIFVTLPLEISIMACLIVSTLVAWGVGKLCSAKRGVYFAMVTLSISMIFYYAAQTFDDLTGGTDGLGGIENMRLGSIGLRVGIMNANVTYYFVFLFTAVFVLIIWQILRSPFGQVLRAVRENEDRARICGYDVVKVRLMAFTLSGAISGMAGALAIIYGETVPIENIHFVTSGQIVIITLFGGAGTFLGPFVGSFIYWYLRQLMSVEFVKYKIICIENWGCLGDIFQYWEAWVGGIFILIVLFVPNGILGTIRALTLEYRAKRHLEKIKEGEGAPPPN
jgi:branched-chain amino acid transport system permease protein